MNTIYIRVVHNKIHSVVAAQAAALASTTTILKELNLGEISYFLNCNQLVDFINSKDRSDPPDWHMLPFIQDFNFAMENTRYSVSKIQRDLNSTTDSLAKLAFNSPQVQFHDYVPRCSTQSHCQQCPLLRALPYVNNAFHRLVLLINESSLSKKSITMHG